jgi:prevent-host-death family protein
MSIVIKNGEMTIPAGQFKAKCLALIDQVSNTHQVITITKRGKPVARLVPLAVEKPRKLFGWFAGHVVEEGDIVGPTGEAWEAEQGDSARG